MSHTVCHSNMIITDTPTCNSGHVQFESWKSPFHKLRVETVNVTYDLSVANPLPLALLIVAPKFPSRIVAFSAPSSRK